MWLLPFNFGNKFSLKTRFIIQYLYFGSSFLSTHDWWKSLKLIFCVSPFLFCHVIGHKVHHSIPLLNFILWQSRWVLIKLFWISTIIQAPNHKWSNTLTFIRNLLCHVADFVRFWSETPHLPEPLLSEIVVNWVAYWKNLFSHLRWQIFYYSGVPQLTTFVKANWL